jgi:hypothetical protein
MHWVEDMFDVELMSQNLLVLNCTTVALIEVCLSNQSSCFALKKFGTPRMVRQASRGSGRMVLKETTITVAPHPSAAYKYCRLPESSS